MMKHPRLLIPLAVVAVLLLLLWGWHTIDRLTTPPDSPAISALHTDEAADDTARWTLLKDGIVLAGAVAGGLLVLGLVAAGGVVLARAVLTVDLVYTDAEGRFPVPRRVLNDGQLGASSVAAWHTTQAIAAKASRAVPTSYHKEVHGWLPDQAPVEGEFYEEGSAPQLPAFTPPTVGEHFERGLFRPGFYLPGYTPEGQALWVPASDGRSLLIAGMGGSGKSTGLVGQILQELVQPPEALGFQEPPRFIVIDPHANKNQSLTKRLVGMENRIVAHARTPDEVLRVCQAFDREGKRRINSGATPYSLVLVADEVSMMYDDADFDEVAPALTDVFIHANTQYRAVGLKAMAGVHMLQAYAFGGKANTRKSFRCRIGYQLDAGDGAMLGLKSPLADTLPTLPPGHCVVLMPGQVPARAIAPNVVEGDVARALAVVQGGPPRQLHTGVTLQPDVVERFNAIVRQIRRPAETPETAETAETGETTDLIARLITQLERNETTGYALPPGEQEAVARRLWQERRTQTDILRLLYRVNPGKNDPYEAARDQYQQWLAGWTAPAEGSTPSGETTA